MLTRLDKEFFPFVKSMLMYYQHSLHLSLMTRHESKRNLEANLKQSIELLWRAHLIKGLTHPTISTFSTIPRNYHDIKKLLEHCIIDTTYHPFTCQSIKKRCLNLLKRLLYFYSAYRVPTVILDNSSQKPWFNENFLIYTDLKSTS